MELLYEGKAKQVFNTEAEDEVIIQFKDDATAFNGEKKHTFSGKGKANLAFTRHFFNILKAEGVKTHIISFIDDTSLKAKKVQIIPIEVVIRNYAAGSICKREGFEKGHKFEQPLCEFFLKDDSKGDPLLSENEILETGLATNNEVIEIKTQALRVNSILSSFLSNNNITLVDFKLEFGKTQNGEILLADEISPDTCRFWIKGTIESLDKDVYREDKGDLVSSYLRLAKILGVEA